MSPQVKSLKAVLGTGAMALALLAAPALVPQSVNLGSTAHAAEEQKPSPKYAKKKTKRVQAMRPKVGKKFQVVQEAAEAENWSEMKRQLDLMKGEMAKYNQFESATVWSMYAYYYYSVENYKQAINSYKNMLKYSDGIPDARITQTLFQIAQLYYAEGDYRTALKYLYQWKDQSEIVTAKNKILIGQAHYQLGELDKSLRWIEEAIADYKAKGKVPEENWYGIQKVIYYDKKNMKKVAEILETLVTYYPKAKYWRQLGGIYSELGRNMDRLVAYDALMIQGKLTKESRLRGLAYMYLGAEVPYKAAQIMEWGVKNGHIEKTEKNYELWGSALYAAVETKKAIPVMEQAAKLSKKGDLMARLAGVYFSDDQFKKTVTAARSARKKGGIKRPGTNWMNEGMALASLKRFGEAERAFTNAAKYEKNKKGANAWLKYISQERRRQKAIADSKKAA